jgi:hypothetical protein
VKRAAGKMVPTGVKRARAAANCRDDPDGCETGGCRPIAAQVPGWTPIEPVLPLLTVWFDDQVCVYKQMI